MSDIQIWLDSLGQKISEKYDFKPGRIRRTDVTLVSMRYRVVASWTRGMLGKPDCPTGKQRCRESKQSLHSGS